jgi:transposase
MIRVPRGSRVWICCRPVDLRKGFGGLAALVQGELGRDLVSGDLFVFVSRNRQLVKILHWDGKGLGLYARRPARGRYVAPWHRRGGGTVRLSSRELQALLAGTNIAASDAP